MKLCRPIGSGLREEDGWREKQFAQISSRFWQVVKPNDRDKNNQREKKNNNRQETENYGVVTFKREWKSTYQETRL